MKQFTLTTRNGLLVSAKAGDTEFIDPGTPFGHVTFRVDGKEFSTESGEFEAVSARVAVADDRYTIALINRGDTSVKVDELSIRFAMNSQFDWGVKGGERVIRHSFIAADGSYFYFTPCDGHGPYLILLPEQGTRLELFDTHANMKDLKGEDRHVYRAFIHAEYEEKIAREKGCVWRQPVSSRVLAPGETAIYAFRFAEADDYRGVRDCLYENGQPDVEIIPGMTVARGVKTLLRARVKGDMRIDAEYPDDTEITLLSREGDTRIYQAVFHRLGENLLTVRWDGDRYSPLEFFVTLPVEQLIRKRGSFIAAHQHKGTGKWYEGLLAEHNNETGALLGPDNYDRIKGWRIYEVTCDDPGLSKPAFLSGKNAEIPEQSEVDALEYYAEHFVWGGLQRADTEEYPYGIYGIPDWKTLRDKTDDIGPTGLTHIWRIYDYPHLALMWLNLYRIGARFPQIRLRLDKGVYLDRAYRTFLALYTYPMEIDEWSPLKTGLYNELAIMDVIDALNAEGRPLAARRLQNHWLQKCKFFITACQDVFGSEYPFDTTGYESTQALAEEALRCAAAWTPRHKYDKQPYTVEDARKFLEYQAQCNIACRGVMENAYHLLGSDYRNCSAHYTLSYMSQMGGQALLRYALYALDQPYDVLRLAYASLLSSWALTNAGDQEGYWFPGEAHNGAAGGGFENTPYGETWLEQPHHRGSWYYSCEIDLGYCGYLRGAATILCDDPLFGLICYGGRLEGDTVYPEDGVLRRFHHVAEGVRTHITLHNARFASITARDRTYTIRLASVDNGARVTIEKDGKREERAINGMTSFTV